MKITCTKCGKRFDADKHMYICPKCNHYQSQVGVNGRSQETVSAGKIFDKKTELSDLFKEKKSSNDRGDDTPEFIQTLNGEQRVYTAQKNTKEKDSDVFMDAASILKKIGLAVCIIIGFIMAISSTFGTFDEWSGDDSSWSDGWDEVYTENEVEFGEPMYFDTFTVNVEGVCEPEFEGLKAEDGYKLVQLNFTTEGPYDYEDEELWAEVELWHSFEDEDGYYEEGNCSMYEDELTSNPGLQQKLLDAGLVTEAHISGSYFCIFEVPEEAEEVTLRITSFVEEDEEWFTQDECFRMDLLL